MPQKHSARTPANAPRGAGNSTPSSPAEAASPGTAGAARPDMRQSIKQVATDLLIRHGYNGMSFRDIALLLNVTTTNIHYHFGNKQGLVDEVVRDYVAEALQRHRVIWSDAGRSLAEKLRQLVQYNWERYQQFNKGRDGGNAWSLIGRLRLENEVLSEAARASLATFTTTVHELIRQAVDEAWRTGELREDTPRQDLAFLIINIVNSSSVFTQGTGGFDRLELFFDAFSRVMLSAYSGTPAAAVAPRQRAAARKR
jgi:TetR/AcrR family transcriptional regulator, transcriptional repressor for nem operon